MQRRNEPHISRNDFKKCKGVLRQNQHSNIGHPPALLKAQSTHVVLEEKEVCAVHSKGFNSPVSPTLKVKLLCKRLQWQRVRVKAYREGELRPAFMALLMR